MICPVAPGTVGCGHGIVGAGPMPTPPELAAALGVDVHGPPSAIRPEIRPAPAEVAAPDLTLPAVAIAPPHVFALALDAPARTNAARLGSIRRIPRMSLSWACGVS